MQAIKGSEGHSSDPRRANVPVPLTLLFAVASWYKTYRLEQVAKEYYIIKPLLRDDRKFGPFIKALDSAILSSGVDDVCEKIYGRPQEK